MSTTDPPISPEKTFLYHPATLILTVLLVLCFFIGFFSVFFCRYFIHTDAFQDAPLAPPDKPVPSGLDPSIMNSFPTFAYSTVKDLRIEKYGLECAICICEFADDDNLRLLPTCCHVFHQDCIDLWLDKNKTCPVCRGNLDRPLSMCGINEDEPLEDFVSIDITHEERDRGGGDRREARVERTEISDKFPRSYSTGHSIKKRDDLAIDRFTLRLPDNVHARLLRGHKWSLTTFGEFTSRTETTSGGFGEISDFA